MHYLFYKGNRFLYSVVVKQNTQFLDKTIKVYVMNIKCRIYLLYLKINFQFFNKCLSNAVYLCPANTILVPIFYIYVIIILCPLDICILYIIFVRRIPMCTLFVT